MVRLCRRTHDHTMHAHPLGLWQDPGLISEVIIPLLSMQNSVLLCISTLLMSGNHYSRMFALKHEDGTPVFETISITLVCDTCLAGDHPELCTHKLHTLPRWISSSKVETVKRMLEDDPSMLMRETLGVCADDSNKAFRSRDVDAMLALPGKAIEAMPGSYGVRSASKFVVIAVDPSGGGGSAFAIAALHYTADNEFAVRRPVERHGRHSACGSLLNVSPLQRHSRAATSQHSASAWLAPPCRKRGITYGNTSSTRHATVAASPTWRSKCSRTRGSM